MYHNDKFVWQAGDIKIIRKEEFEETAIKYSAKPLICTKNPYCKKCDTEQKNAAEELVAKIFYTFFVAQPYDESIFRRVMQNLSLLCKKALGENNVLTKELYYCVKSCLITKIKESTTIEITHEMVEQLLK